MLRNIGLVIRKQKLRYVVVVVLLCILCWVGYWLRFLATGSQNDLEKLYNVQGPLHKHPKNLNSNLPRLNNMKKDSSHHLDLDKRMHKFESHRKPQIVDTPEIVVGHRRTVEGNNGDKQLFPVIKQHEILGALSQNYMSQRKVSANNVRETVENKDDEQRFPVIKVQETLGGQLGVRQDDMDMLQRKIIGNNVLEIENSRDLNKIGVVKKFVTTTTIQAPDPAKLQVVTTTQAPDPAKLKAQINDIEEIVKKFPGSPDTQVKIHQLYKLQQKLKQHEDRQEKQRKQQYQEQQKVVQPNDIGYLQEQGLQSQNKQSQLPEPVNQQQQENGHLKQAQQSLQSQLEDLGEPENKLDFNHHYEQLFNKPSLDQQNQQKVFPSINEPAKVSRVIPRNVAILQMIKDQDKAPQESDFLHELAGDRNRKQNLLRKEINDQENNIVSVKTEPKQRGKGPLGRGNRRQDPPNQAIRSQDAPGRIPAAWQDSGAARKSLPGKEAPYTLVHAGRASKAPVGASIPIQSLPPEIPKTAYVLEAERLPEDERLRPSIGNGHLATVIHGRYIHMAGFYNGYEDQSHRAEIPSTVSVRFSGTQPETNYTRKHVLNVGEGVYSEVCEHKFYRVTQRVFAHREIPGLLVVEFDLAMSSYYPLKLSLSLNRWRVSADITFSDRLINLTEVSLKVGKITAPENYAMTYDQVFVLFDHIPDTLEPPEGSIKTKWIFLTAIGASQDEVLQLYHTGSNLIHNGDQLYGTHVHAWHSLWEQSYIDISGNVTITRALFSSFYYLYSSIPLYEETHWPYTGLSPSGLPLGSFDTPQDHHGRVLPDQELWMFPAVLTFRPDMAKLLLKSRSRLAARRGAAQLAQDNGLSNCLQYPWEVGITGSNLTDPKDAHYKAAYVSGLVSQAVKRYLDATNDTSILKDQQYAGILTAIANYYQQILISNFGGLQSKGVNNVQSPDLFARFVDNSVFTNAVASLALQAPELVYSRIGRIVDSKFTELAENVYIPFKDGYHPEYHSYEKGTMVQQADVVSLGYPLQWEMSPDIRQKDLETYEKVTDPQAPPTTWAMHAIGWLEVGDVNRGHDVFDRQFFYFKNDFQVWTEKGTTRGVSNYLSGAGAFIQSVVNGYLGLRFHSDRLIINPVLPPGAEKMRFVGVKYLGSALDIWVFEQDITIQVMLSHPPTGKGLKIYSLDPPYAAELEPGKSQTVKRRKIAILTESAELPDTL